MSIKPILSYLVNRVADKENSSEFEIVLNMIEINIEQIRNRIDTF